MKILGFLVIPATMALSGFISYVFHLDVGASILVGAALGIPAGLLTGAIFLDN